MGNLPEDLGAGDKAHVEDILAAKQFDRINQTQKSFLEQGGLEEQNTLLVAETGNGKTLCAEFRIQKALRNGRNVAYLVPSKQLTSGKYETLTEWIDPEETDIRNATQETPAGYTEADVIIATFESYFEAVLRGIEHNLDLLVFDDFHELYSKHRGPTIEQGIAAALHRGAEIFAMSATVGNPDEIARWTDANLVISPEDRGVPITEYPIEVESPKYGELISEIIRDNQQKKPFIVFNYRKSHAESRAIATARQTSFSSPDGEYREELKQRLDTTLTDRHKTLIDLMEEGVAFHHSDLDSETKALVEKAVKSGDIQLVSATTTLAYGFDAPVQSVIVADLKRGWGFNQRFIGRWEYIQWIGRAGRDEEQFDEALAFPLYSDEEAIDRFEFGTAVENKSLESIASHLGVSDQVRESEDFRRLDFAEIEQNFRWLILELICSGWNRLQEVVEFIQHTLYWHQMREPTPAPGDAQVIGDSAKVDELVGDVKETLAWLHSQGLIRNPGPNQFQPTDAGSACFEFRHSTWIQTSISDLLRIQGWIEDQEEIVPEQLVAKLAEVYDDCDLGVSSPHDQFKAKLAEVGLDPESHASHTAGIIAWFWCDGIPVDSIEDALEVDLSHLSTVAQRDLASTVDALSHLIKPSETSIPPWFDTFVDQLEYGVTPADLYLTKIPSIGRGIVTNLEAMVNSGIRDINTEWSTAAPLIYKLVERWSEYEDRQEYENRIQQADLIASKRSERITDAVIDWDQELKPTTKPNVHTSARELLESWGNDGDSTISILTGDSPVEDKSSETNATYSSTSLEDFS